MKRPHIIVIAGALLLAGWTAVFLKSSVNVRAQGDPGPLRVGERLTYAVSFEKFRNVAYAETYIVSRGRLGDREALEVHTKLKTLDFVSAAYLMLDRVRASYISPVDGTTLAIKDTEYGSGLPVESSLNYVEKAAGSFDLVAMICKIRASNGIGSVTLFENERSSVVTFNTIGTEVIRSDVGEFPTNIVEVKSDHLTELGIVALKINIASDASAVPVQYRIKTAKGEFRALISSIQVVEPDPVPTPTPAVAQSPSPSPRPSPSIAPYVADQPLDQNLPFRLGETLNYAVTTGGNRIGDVRLAVGGRRLVNNRDSLLLSATVTAAQGNAPFRANDLIKSNVDPVTFAPFDLEFRFNGPMAAFNQVAGFDPNSSVITIGQDRIDAPVGTHSIISLAYAIRLFNLTPSKVVSNPVNDTRVAVLWQGRPLIFTLRPSQPAAIEFGGQKISVQEVSVTTGDPLLDGLQIKIWLTMDARRVPVRAKLGTYQLDLDLGSSDLR